MWTSEDADAGVTSKPILVIGDKNYSSWSLRPWLLLRHHGIAFDEVRLPLDTPEFAGGVARWSPSARVPVLHHGDRVIWDSLAICEYVNETFLDGRGWPADASARATARAASAEMHSGFQALRTSLPMNCRKRVRGFEVPADARRDIARIAHLWRDCRARFGRQGAFLFGGFTIADAMYAPVASRLRSYGVELGGVERDYVEALLDLPALQEWLADAAAEAHALPKYDSIA
jgi:glutathione S-transferase